MFSYRTVLGILLIFIMVRCYQAPNPEPNGLLIPSQMWSAQNYMKNWMDTGHGPPPPSVPLLDPNPVGELDERFLDKRQEPQQSQQQQQQQSPYSAAVGLAALSGGDAGTTYVDADAATVAAMQFELQSLVQTKYQAEAAIKMETGEIARTQHEAQEAERALEEATNNVRMISAHLKNAQEEASKAATRALTAQLQMSVHDQLLVTARQKLNSVTAHMIALQADLAGAQQRFMLNNSTKELETRAHALHLRPETNLVAFQNGELPLFASNFLPQSSIGGQQHNSGSMLSPAELWHQQLEPNQQQQQQPSQQAGWSPFSQLASSQDLQKTSNPAAPIFLNAKKI
ncbi:uncharacterized protein isoform X3 [Rhodnius prolixus]|uniref:uncharacterized protein isoform X3 n=1 Tax=Rhodnius prolixus TaxID=13249 RepID=UPI003D18CAE2